MPYYLSFAEQSSPAVTNNQGYSELTLSVERLHDIESRKCIRSQRALNERGNVSPAVDYIGKRFAIYLHLPLLKELPT